jgi:hypothetical protein
VGAALRRAMGAMKGIEAMEGMGAMGCPEPPELVELGQGWRWRARRNWGRRQTRR